MSNWKLWWWKPLLVPGLDCHPASRGSCGSERTGSCWRRWALLGFSLWWWWCCWAATSTWCLSTAPPGSSCRVTGSRTWRTAGTRRTRLTEESSATCGISSASAGRWCGSRCTTTKPRTQSKLWLDGPGPRQRLIKTDLVPKTHYLIPQKMLMFGVFLRRYFCDIGFFLWQI